MAAGPASYGMTDTMGRMHSDAQFAGSSSVPAHVEMMEMCIRDRSVAFAFLDKVDIDPETLFKVTEGLGLGMGGMEGTCGAISACLLYTSCWNF